MKKNHSKRNVLQAGLAITIMCLMISPIISVSAKNNNNDGIQSPFKKDIGSGGDFLDDEIIYVDDSNINGPWDGSYLHPYRYIQAGINHASNGAIVYVRNGVYLISSPIIVNRSIVLVGEDSETTSIIASTTIDTIVRISAGSVQFQWFTLTWDTGSPPQDSASIRVTSSYNHLFGNVIFADSTCYGIKLSSAHHNTIAVNNIYNSRYGIFLEQSEYTTLFGNTIVWNNQCDYPDSSDNWRYDDIVGIYISSSNNNTLSANLITDAGDCYQHEKGISLISTNNTLLSENTISNNYFNIKLCVCHNVTIRSNTLTSPIFGIIIIYGYNTIISENTISDLVYYNGVAYGIYLGSYYGHNIISDNSISGIDADEMGIFSGDDYATITGNYIIGNNNEGTGISFCGYANTISMNYVSLVHIGIEVGYFNHYSYLSAYYSTVSKNIITNVDTGILVDVNSYNDNILRNNISHASENGIRLAHSTNTTVSYNRIIEGGHGITLFGQAENNTITENVINGNSGTGILLDQWSQVCSPNNNHIYHNNLVSNTVNAVDEDGDNVWDNGYVGGGNYWDDYTGVDGNDDGIGDTSYIFSGSQDNNPLMHPFVTSVDGTIVRITLEGHTFYGIQADDGRHFHPMNLPLECRVEGLQCTFSGYLVKSYPIPSWGDPIHLTSIEAGGVVYLPDDFDD
jgi:parallel beta-helix repeat protein